jgi:hypothetical protein
MSQLKIIIFILDEADDASSSTIPKPQLLPQTKKPTEKKAPVVIEVYENKTAQPRKSSLMISSPGRMVRKRSVTILPPEGMQEISSSEDGKLTY